MNVLYGSATGLTGTGSQQFTQVGGAVEAGDQFGSALAAGDFDNDGFADLAAGAPFESVGSIVDAGAVSVLPGSAAGLTTAGGQLFTQVGGTVEAGDLFGFAVAAGDFDGDTFADLAAGRPGRGRRQHRRRRGGQRPARLRGRAHRRRGPLFTQVGSQAEAFDLFGFALAAGDFDNDTFVDLAAGALFEGVGRTVDAGAVSVLPGSAGGLTAAGGRLFTQVGGSGGGGRPVRLRGGGRRLRQRRLRRSGRRCPGRGGRQRRRRGGGERAARSAGRLTATGGQLFTQVGGAVETDDGFGSALAAGDFDNDTFADLAAGAPFEDVGSNERRTAGSRGGSALLPEQSGPGSAIVTIRTYVRMNA